MATVLDFLNTIPMFVWWTAGAIATAVIGLTALRAASRAIRRGDPADLLTYLAASIATSVSAQGMWQFFEKAFPGIPWQLRAALFAFIEVAVLASAVRARKNMRDSAQRAKTDTWVTPSAGIDGTAVWVLTGLSAVLSSLEAASPPEFLFRLAAPLVAAWLWERGMAIERQRITGRKRINWRLTPERVLVRLGIAESSDRTASEVDAHRRLTRVAKAAKRARTLEHTGAWKWRQGRALVKLDRAVERAVEHAGLAADEDRQRQMLDQIGAIFSAGDLRNLPAVAPWSTLTHPLTGGTSMGTQPGTPDPADSGQNSPDVPEVPAERPATLLPVGPVPDELYPVAVERYAPQLATRKIPGIKRIKDDLRVGQPKAEAIQSYLKDLARTWPPAPRDDAPKAPEVTFKEPPNGSATPLADEIPMTEVA